MLLSYTFCNVFCNTGTSLYPLSPHWFIFHKVTKATLIRTRKVILIKRQMVPGLCQTSIQCFQGLPIFFFFFGQEVEFELRAPYHLSHSAFHLSSEYEWTLPLWSLTQPCSLYHLISCCPLCRPHLLPCCFWGIARTLALWILHLMFLLTRIPSP